MPEPEPVAAGQPPPWAERLERWRAGLPLPAPAVLAAGAVVVALVIAAVALLGGRSSPAPLVLPKAGPAASPAPTTLAAAAAAAAAETTVAVHAAGAVARPGLYVLPGGSRVADVVAAAGGPVAEADLDQLNLATKIVDGDRVHVPRRGEMVAGSGPTPGGGAPPTSRPATVDLNAATAEQLDDLPGIGPALARAIVDHRTRHGRFRAVDDLLDVRGIGPAKLDGLRDLVRV